MKMNKLFSNFISVVLIPVSFTSMSTAMENPNMKVKCKNPSCSKYIEYNKEGQKPLFINLPGIYKETYITARQVALPCGCLVCTSCLELSNGKCFCPICKKEVDKLNFLTDEELKSMYEKCFNQSYKDYKGGYPALLKEKWPFYVCGELFDKPVDENKIGLAVFNRLANALYRGKGCCDHHTANKKQSEISLPVAGTTKLESRYVALPCGHFECMKVITKGNVGDKFRCLRGVPRCKMIVNPMVILNDEELLSAYGKYVRSDENGKEYLDESLKSKIELTLWARVSNALIVKNGRICGSQIK